MIKKITQNIAFKIITYIFALVGFFLTLGFVAVRFGLTNTQGIIDRQSEYFRKQNTHNTGTTTSPAWTHDAEYQNFKQAITNDVPVLKRVESETGVPERLIVSMVFVEQMRLYYTDRALFKELFAPLKILGTQTKFSLGVSGIKEETAKQIEQNLKDPTSPYYLGSSYEHYLDFKTTDIDKERFARLTDYKNRYYSYLYTALYLKELMTSWNKAGYSIDQKPEVVATLFNIGFEHSVPKPDPLVGGAQINVNDTTYSFGGLAHEFYYSDELLDIFPRN